jgi:hypothetical protein
MRTGPFAYPRGVRGAAGPATGRGRGRLTGGFRGSASSTSSAAWSQAPTCSGQLIDVSLAQVDFVAGSAVVQSNRRDGLGAVTMKIARKHDTGGLSHNSSLQRHTLKWPLTCNQHRDHRSVALTPRETGGYQREIAPARRDAAQRSTYAARDRRAAPPERAAAAHRRLGVADLLAHIGERGSTFRAVLVSRAGPPRHHRNTTIFGVPRRGGAEALSAGWPRRCPRCLSQARPIALMQQPSCLDTESATVTRRSGARRAERRSPRPGVQPGSVPDALA